MDLEYPEDHEDSVRHPIPDRTVEAVHAGCESRYGLQELHAKLAVVQAAFENELSSGRLYDPLMLFGRAGNRMKRQEYSPYKENLYLEDGEHQFSRTSNGTEGVPLLFGVWSAVADLLYVNVESDELNVVRECHEREYGDSIEFQTEYATSGFVVGLPEMYLAGMRAEQRVFSALAGSGLEPAKIVDSYGNRVSYPSDVDWAEKRGVSRSAVSQARTGAREFLSGNYPTGTIPRFLIPEPNPR